MLGKVDRAVSEGKCFVPNTDKHTPRCKDECAEGTQVTYMAIIWNKMESNRIWSERRIKPF